MSTAERRATVLVVDDEPGICRALRSYLEGDGHRAITAPNAEVALDAVRTTRPDLAFVDLRLPGMDGLALLERLREAHPGVEVILITAYGGVETAMRATREGAYAYLQKPIDLDEIGRIVRRNMARPTVAVGPADSTAQTWIQPVFCGTSQAVERLRERVAALAATDAPVLMVGEVGSGREAVGRDLAQKLGRAFLRVSCAALDADERVPYNQDEATVPRLVFFDAIEDLADARRLRMLSEIPRLQAGPTRHAASLSRTASGVATVRIEQVVAVAQERGWGLIEVPPLRDRLADLPELVAVFLSRASQETGRAVRGVDALAMDQLAAHGWPGNLRELENAIRVGVVSTREDVLVADTLVLPDRPTRRGNE